MRFAPTIAALLLLAAALTPAAAQRRDTRFELLGSDIDTTPTTLTVDASNLIGQTQHTFTVTLTDADGQTCAGGFVSMAVQGSYDGTAWRTIGDPLSNIQADQYGAYVGVARADVAYPRVRFVITSFDTTNCVAEVFYAGTLAPTNQPQASLLYPIYAIADGSDADETSMVVATDGYSQHTAYVDWNGCSGGAVTFKLQAAWESAGPWVDITDDVSVSYSQPDFVGYQAQASGEYPLVRAYIHLTVAVSCTGGATIYYWGSNGDREPFRRFALGTKQSLNFVQADRTSAGSTTLVPAATDRLYEILFLSLVAPCAGVDATVAVGSDDLIDSQDGPFSVVWPLTGHHYFSGARNNAITFTTAGTGCAANVALQYRIVDRP